jgi:hypothetical protein
MRITTIALALGIVVALLGLLGIVSGDGRIAGEMNIDFMLDIARIGLGVLLIYGGLRSDDMSRTALSVFGVAYLGMFILGLVSPILFGLLPAGLGMIDQILHIGGGIVGIYFGMLTTRDKAAI